MCLQCCYSRHLKVIWYRMMPSCLQKQELHECSELGTEVRQLTLEELLYPQPSWEMGATEGTPARRYSPKVCPLNSDFSSESNSPIINESISIGGVSVRSQNSAARRVSFRSPHEYDVFTIPARDSDDDSSDGEPPRI
ncbi:hypothetical protein CFC21_108848 [Triticum aestivum]|uniref:Uncharacterized protein n=3 Tax=Triticinae TaxID=1648030 RepID=A0A3B6TI87_WHEAT|nr:hypothetical protein CFC21_108848 [Triticum aestivum]